MYMKNKYIKNVSGMWFIMLDTKDSQDTCVKLGLSSQNS